MVSIFCEPRENYSIVGCYQGDGVSGKFSGEFRYYSDRKIIGNLVDECAGISLKKLILGVHSPEEDNLSFVQLSNLSTFPLLWTTQRCPGGKNLGKLGESYGGFWIFLSDIYIPVGLNSLTEHKLPRLNDVEDIPAEELRQSYFTNQMIKKTRLNAMKHALCGAINLRLKTNQI